MQTYADQSIFNQITDRRRNEDDKVVAEAFRHYITAITIMTLHRIQTRQIVFPNIRNTQRWLINAKR